MREDICSIPVSEIFAVQDGCPFCRMYKTLEERVTDFIMGAAMMEPDIRIETNRLGFCDCHYKIMLKKNNRLSLALMLESHLAEIDKQGFSSKIPVFHSHGKHKAEKITQSCFTCSKIDWGMERLTNTFFKLWVNEKEFRELAASQPFYCMPHYSMLLEKGKTAMDKKHYADFANVITEKTKAAIISLKSDVSGFCRMFDYRNDQADWGNSKDAIERSIVFLTGSADI